MANTPGYSSIQQIVSEFLLTIDDHEKKHFRWAISEAVRCVTDLHIHYINSRQVASIEVNENGTVTLPPDYIDYIKVGSVYGNGFFLLGHNPGLAIPPGLTCGDYEVSGYGAGIEQIGNIYYVSSIGDKTFEGRPGKKTSEFRVVAEPGKEKYMIVIGSVGTVYIEYISSGINAGETTYLPVVAVPAVLAWLEYRYFLLKTDSPAVKVQMAYMMYTHELRKVSEYESTPTLQELRDFLFKRPTLNAPSDAAAPEPPVPIPGGVETAPPTSQAGTMYVLGGIPTKISFAQSFTTADYALTIDCYDENGNSVEVQVTQMSKGFFYVTAAFNGTVHYHAVYTG